MALISKWILLFASGQNSLSHCSSREASISDAFNAYNLSPTSFLMLFFFIFYRRGLCPLIKRTIATRQILSPCAQNPKSHKGNTTSSASKDRTVAITAADQVRDEVLKEAAYESHLIHLIAFQIMSIL